MKDKLAFKFMSATIAIIISVMTVHFLWDYNQQKRQALIEMREKAQVITKQLVATREFISINQDKINFDSQGNYEFKHLNPAAVVMGTSGIFSRLTDYQIKQTRLNYRHPQNAPDLLEISVLEKFQQNPELQEFCTEDVINGKRVFRYMIPLRIEKSCLPCHGEPVGSYDVAGYPKEGYSEGSIGGAISLVMPMDIFLVNLKANAMRYGSFFLILIAIYILSIYFLMKKLVTAPLGELEKAVKHVSGGNLNIDLRNLKADGEIKQLACHFQRMADQLRDFYNNLEQKVEERTLELEKANQILKLSEQQLTKTNLELEKANQVKTDFLAIMSHELRTPLTSIIAYTQFLLDDIPKEFELERQNLKEIESSSETLLHLINNILDMAKIEAGRHEVNLETMDMGEVIYSVEGMIMPLVQTRGLHLTTYVAPTVPLIKGDPEKIRRVVQNLAGNAIKFTERDGKVEISVDYAAEKNEVIIKVADTGIGIKREDQKLIFGKFTQSDNSISRKYSGTGLGLALAKELVEMHGGWITLESVPGQGSTFMVGIPAGVVD